MPNVINRNRVAVSGVPNGRPMVFAHGFGCDQRMWRFVAPDFEVDHRVVLFDHVGSGHSELSAYDPEKYGSLHGYASDVVEICRDLELSDVVFVAPNDVHQFCNTGAEPMRFLCLIPNSATSKNVNVVPECGIELS